MRALEANGEIRLVDADEEALADRTQLETALAELEAARETIANLQAQLNAWVRRYETDMAQARRDAAVDRAILQAKGRNVKAIRALLDMDHIVLKEDGSLEGLDLEALKRSDGYLFGEEIRKKQGPGLNNGPLSNRERMKKQFETAVWAR